ncbi:uncharacterized protein LOC129891086 [Solanum dulcamara]|uniref:uncharacterized protein LOC129891086 n=1 Tax=Solanum dulcamara TaxID=45834 RepID=UPI002485EDE6|nr:uncharacterized protein LOC129891086 [Solanum dulcamara]
MDPPHSQTQLRNSWRGAKFSWRAVLIFNLGLGAYLFTRPAKKEKKPITRQPITPAETTNPTPPALQNFEPIFAPIPEPVKVPESLSKKQQHSVFGWMLKDKEEGQTSKPRREEDN